MIAKKMIISIANAESLSCGDAVITLIPIDARAAIIGYQTLSRSTENTLDKYGRAGIIR